MFSGAVTGQLQKTQTSKMCMELHLQAVCQTTLLPTMFTFFLKKLRRKTEN